MAEEERLCHQCHSLAMETVIATFAPIIDKSAKQFGHNPKKSILFINFNMLRFHLQFGRNDITMYYRRGVTAICHVMWQMTHLT